MHYLFTPLQEHFDRGFGAVANSFKYAADLVASPSSSSPSLNPHLPASFLYRHAVELYLKSGILIFHRKFQLPWGTNGDGEPSVPMSGKWKPLNAVHRLAPLYARLKALFADHAEYLKSHASTDWELPSELDAWVAAIDATDSSSTFFRYPVTKHVDRDPEKSTVKRDDYLNIMSRMGPDSPAQKMFMVIDQDDKVVEAFCRDDSAAKSTMQTLQQTAEFLYACHAALRGELTDGW